MDLRLFDEISAMKQLLHLFPVVLRGQCLALLLCFVAVFGSGVCAYAQYDLTGNGTPDLVLTKEEPDGRLRWLAQDLETGQVEDLGIFGPAGYQLNVALVRLTNSLLERIFPRGFYSSYP
jgi:hypothetical protein